MLLIVRSAVPLFVSVTGWVAEVVPTRCPPKPTLAGANETAGVGPAPVPERASACDVSGASSAIETVAVRVPRSEGVKVTESVHVAPGARVAGAGGQSPLAAKSGVPASSIEEIVNGVLPEFVSAEVRAALVEPTSWDPKARAAGASVTAGAGATPVPVSETTWGLAGASSLTVSEALRPPAPPGVNRTAIVQLAPAASVAGHWSASEKSAASAPPTAIDPIASAALPTSVSVTSSSALVDPIGCPGKATLVGVSVTAGAVPVPLRASECGLPAASSVIVTEAARLPAVDGVNVAEIVQAAPAASAAGASGQSL